MKKIFVIFILILSYSTLQSQSYLPKLGNSDAHDNYFLKGKPLTLYHQTFEISQDSLTGKIIIGNELDYFSELSYRINFTDEGNVLNFHYIHEGISSTSTCNFFDPEGRLCKLQIHNNIPVSYQRNRIDNYEEVQDQNKGHIYKLIQEEYSMSYFSDSLLLTKRDTTICIEKDSIMLSLFMPDTDTQHDSYPIKDSLYYALFIDSCRNNQLPHSRTINLYNEQEQIIKIIEYTPISKLPSFIELFYYNEQGLVILDKRFNYVSFNEFGDTIYLTEPTTDIYRYEYPENSIDEQENWTQRYVFRRFRQEKEQPLYMERRKISYLK